MTRERKRDREERRERFITYRKRVHRVHLMKFGSTSTAIIYVISQQPQSRNGRVFLSEKDEARGETTTDTTNVSMDARCIRSVVVLTPFLSAGRQSALTRDHRLCFIIRGPLVNPPSPEDHRGSYLMCFCGTEVDARVSQRSAAEGGTTKQSAGNVNARTRSIEDSCPFNDVK